jgi:hypothetical protein
MECWNGAGMMEWYCWCCHSSVHSSIPSSHRAIPWNDGTVGIDRTMERWKGRWHDGTMDRGNDIVVIVVVELRIWAGHSTLIFRNITGFYSRRLGKFFSLRVEG